MLFSGCPQNNLGDILMKDFAEHFAKCLVETQKKLQSIHRDLSVLHQEMKKSSEEMLISRKKDQARVSQGKQPSSQTCLYS